MDRCPPEIHARIFSYACMDDGTTGCSLSLVSKYIREVSLPYQWQCISLAKSQCIIQLATQIRKSEGKRPVFHLFLGDRHPAIPFGYTRAADYSTHALDVLQALSVVLEYVSESLETLTFFSDTNFFDGAIVVRHLLSFPYPRLNELTVRACCTPRQLAGYLRGDSLPCHTPKLERLHLALPYHGFSNDNLQATHNLIQSISPHLSHLRFSMLDKWGSRRVIEVIHAELAASNIVTPVLDLPPLDWDSPSTAIASPVTWDRLLPVDLQFFAIQPSPTSTFYCSCCMDLPGDVDVIRILERMSLVSDKNRFAYMDRRAIRARKCRLDPMEVAGYGYIEARRDWQARIREESGCWKRKDAPDLDVEGSDEKIVADSKTPTVVPPPRISRLSKLRCVVRRLKMW